MATTTSAVFHHASAPNSPVFSKRPQTELFTISSSSHHCKTSQTMLQTSNSMQNNTNLTNHINNNNYNNSNSSHNGDNGCLSGSQLLRISNKSPINKSPSPCSSLSSSEMNILQELQQHALFKLPTVDRSVSVYHTHTAYYVYEQLNEQNNNLNYFSHISTFIAQYLLRLNEYQDICILFFRSIIFICFCFIYIYYFLCVHL